MHFRHCGLGDFPGSLIAIPNDINHLVTMTLVIAPFLLDRRQIFDHFLVQATLIIETAQFAATTLPVDARNFFRIEFLMIGEN